MNYKAMKVIRESIQRALAADRITAAEALTLTHHYAMSSRSAKRYTSDGDKSLLADIAKRVRQSTINTYL
tara:strand:+ start:1257 stop:1466 length:210 start_codon:yes stop_codon:yes gene_type:complete